MYRAHEVKLKCLRKGLKAGSQSSAGACSMWPFVHLESCFVWVLDYLGFWTGLESCDWIGEVYTQERCHQSSVAACRTFSMLSQMAGKQSLQLLLAHPVRQPNEAWNRSDNCKSHNNGKKDSSSSKEKTEDDSRIILSFRR